MQLTSQGAPAAMDERATQQQQQPEAWCARPRQQHLLVAAIFAGFFLQALQRSCINLVAIGDDGIEAEFGWSSSETSLVLSSFFYGYSLGQIPAGWAVARWGGRRLYSALVLPTMLSMLTPWIVPLGPRSVAAQRAVYGVLMSPMYPTALTLVARWARPWERSRFLALVTAGVYLGSAGSTAVAAWVDLAVGWRGVFLVFGAASLLWLPAWYRWGWSSPEEHPRLDGEELALIAASQAHGPTGDDVDAGASGVLWCALYSHPAMWAMLLHTMSSSMVTSLFTNLGPTYIQQQLGYDLEETGFLSSMPSLLSLLVSLASSHCADSMLAQGVPATRVRKLFTMAACAACGLCSLLLCMDNRPSITVALICLAPAVREMAVAGSQTATMEIAPKYCSIIAGIDNTVWALSTAVAGTLQGALLDLSGCPQGAGCGGAWRLAFMSTGICQVIAGGVYMALGSADPLDLSCKSVHQCPLSPGGATGFAATLSGSDREDERPLSRSMGR